MNKKYYSFILIVMSLLMASLACTAGENAPSNEEGEGQSDLVPTATFTVQSSDSGADNNQDTDAGEDTSDSDTPDQVATATLVPTVTHTAPPPVDTGTCEYDGHYVADVTIPDNTRFNPGESFTKTWELMNDGTCRWETGTQLVYVSGDTMGASASVSAPVLESGDTAQVSVDFTAPASNGTYKSNWRLQTPDGALFGPTIYVQIIVPKGEPDLRVSSLSFDGTPEEGEVVQVIATLRNRGDVAATGVKWSFQPCDGCAWIQAPGSYNLDPDESVDATLDYAFPSCGTIPVLAYVDREAQIVESNEENNTRQVSVEVSCSSSPVTVSLGRVVSHSGPLGPGGWSNELKLGIAPNGDALRMVLEFDLSELDGLDSESTIQTARLDISDFTGESCFEFLHPLMIYRIEYVGVMPMYPVDFEGYEEVLHSAPSGAEIFNPINIRYSMRQFVQANGAGKYQVRMELEHDDAGSAFACMMHWTNPVINITYLP
jgi:hypothetical protein